MVLDLWGKPPNSPWLKYVSVVGGGQGVAPSNTPFSASIIDQIPGCGGSTFQGPIRPCNQTGGSHLTDMATVLVFLGQMNLPVR